MSFPNVWIHVFLEVRTGCKRVKLLDLTSLGEIIRGVGYREDRKFSDSQVDAITCSSGAQSRSYFRLHIKKRPRINTTVELTKIAVFYQTAPERYLTII